jgi:hypothetical protein
MGALKNAAFGDRPAAGYPAEPGYRVAGPSQDAARQFAPAAKSIRGQVLRAIIAAGSHGATSDELMEALGLAEIVIRPRVSELKRAGEIMDSGQRRRGNSGMGMTVWIVAPPLPDHPHLKGTAA